jgi:hypothetical protein
MISCERAADERHLPTAPGRPRGAGPAVRVTLFSNRVVFPRRLEKSVISLGPRVVLVSISALQLWRSNSDG